MTKKTEAESPPNPNMELWNRLCKTNPAHTKQVKKSATSREFTAIDAHSQVMAATEVWGPCGGAWGFSWEWIPDPDMWIATVTLRYPAKTDAPGHVGGVMECKVSQVGTKKRKNKYGVEDDAPKMAITDGLTKCFSYTGMNADVFLGKWENNKYVAEMLAEFGINPNAEPIHPGKPDRLVPPDARAAGRKRIEILCGALCGDKPPREYFTGLAADLGLPTQTDNMTDDQFATITAELEALEELRTGAGGRARSPANGPEMPSCPTPDQGELPTGAGEGPPLSAYDDEPPFRGGAR